MILGSTAEVGKPWTKVPPRDLRGRRRLKQSAGTRSPATGTLVNDKGGEMNFLMNILGQRK